MQFYAKTFVKIVKIAHNLELEVHIDPWGVGKVFAGEAYSNFTNLYPETKQVLFSGRIVPCACVNNKKFIKFIKCWILKAKEIGADGIFWDEPHYFLDWEGIGDNSWACKCEVCQEFFKKKYGYKMPAKLTNDVREFRQESMLNFLKYICDYSKKYQMKNTMCLLSRHREKSGTLNWNKIAKIDSINTISTSAYYLLRNEKVDFVSKITNEILNVAQKNNKEAQIWIQLFGIPKGKEKEVRTAIKLALETGIKNIAFWGFKACGFMSHFVSANPELVWKETCSAVKRIRKEGFC